MVSPRMWHIKYNTYICAMCNVNTLQTQNNKRARLKLSNGHMHYHMKPRALNFEPIPRAHLLKYNVVICKCNGTVGSVYQLPAMYQMSI
jgi:hypothetical protein